VLAGRTVPLDAVVRGAGGLTDANRHDATSAKDRHESFGTAITTARAKTPGKAVISEFRKAVSQLVTAIDSRWTWPVIKQVVTSRYVRGLSIWAVIVPPVARVLENVPPEIELLLGGEPFRISVGLPFTWWLLYCAALSSLVASTVYYVWCPTIVQLHRDFAAY
jgi:hypothetical protein